MNNSYLKIYSIIVLSMLFTSCKLPSERLSEAITPKVHDYSKVNTQMASCNFNTLESIILKENDSDFLKNAEIGLIKYYQKNDSLSNRYFTKAINEYENYEDKPIFSISSFVRNDYQGEGYDRVFLHNYKAINYLVNGNFEDARVESKNSNLVQTKERERLNNFIEKNKSKKSVPSVYQELFSRVNSNINPYQNPFAYYISALSYLEDNDYDNATMDIRNALRYNSNSYFLKKKLQQLSQNKNNVTVELFFDVGKSPIKTAIRQKMNMGSLEKHMVHLPSFEVYSSDISYIKIVDEDNQEVTRTSILSDINAIKINEFKEKLPSILYMYTKESSMSIVSKMVEKKSIALAILMRSTNALYSKSNISTWSLLPEKILVASFPYSLNKKYSMMVISKSGRVLSQKALNLNKKQGQNNIYEHFTIRSNRICQ